MKVLNFLKLILVFVLANICGCVSVPYQQPNHGPFAYLSFNAHNLDGYKVTIYDDGFECSGAKDATQLFKNGQTIKIPANQEVAFSVDWVGKVMGIFISESCYDLLFSFFSEANQRYVLSFNTLAGSCHINVDKTLKGQTVPVKIHRRTVPAIWEGVKGHCEPFV